MNSKIIAWLVLFFCTYWVNGQELNCKVNINAEQLSQSNNKTFVALQNSVQNFMNTTVFTEQNYNQQQKIDCYINFQVTSYDKNIVTGVLRVGSSRLVYGSTYQTPIFTYKEDNVSFPYIEYEPLVYSNNSYTSELVAILSYYAHLFIALDKDTFSMLGGSDEFQKVLTITNLAQVSGGEGWQQGKNQLNRYYLISDLMSTSYLSYRKAMYYYHIHGIDLLSEDPLKAKNGIFEALKYLEGNYKTRANNLPNRVFFDAKANEIESIFTAGVSFDNKALTDLLNKINSANSAKWYRM